MKATKLLYFGAVVIFGFAANLAYAQGNSNGHGKGHDKDKHSDGDQDRDGGDYEYSYSKHDRDELKNWYDHHRENLPPGLAKRIDCLLAWKRKW